LYNPFTKHPKDTVGESWWKHFIFSGSISVRLLITSIYFLVHGIFPFIELHTKWNLKCASIWLNKKNENRRLKNVLTNRSRKIKRKFPPNDFDLPKHKDINSGDK